MKRNSIFKKPHPFYTKFLQGLLLSQTTETEELHMGLPYIIATTSLCGYGENQQVVEIDEVKSLIAHNFARQNCLG